MTTSFTGFFVDSHRNTRKIIFRNQIEIDHKIWTAHLFESICPWHVSHCLHAVPFLQVYCYALSQNDGSEWRQRISVEAEHFIDVSAASSDAIAKMIAEHNIQILVNLNGYTKVRKMSSKACSEGLIVRCYNAFALKLGLYCRMWYLKREGVCGRVRGMKYLLYNLRQFKYHTWDFPVRLVPSISTIWSPTR